MNKIDPIQEQERLRNLYSGMADEELDKLRGAVSELTEPAREALKAEIERRGGHVESDPEPAAAEDPHPKLVVVARYRDLEEATIARGVLQSAGIDTFLADENTVRMDWFWSNMIGNMRLMVRADDEEAAREILDQPMPESFPIDSEEPFEQPKCPKCGSLDIRFEGLDRGVGLATAWVLAPLPVRRDAWQCNACGAHWQELADETDS